MKLGQTIIGIRKEYGMTQEEFAERFYVTRQTVSNWEREKSYPDLLTLVKISDEFGISLDVMLKEDKKMVAKMNREIRLGKKGRQALAIIAVGLIIINIVWFSVWKFSGQNAESKFNSGIKACGFAETEIGYMMYIDGEKDKNVYFMLPNQKMPAYTDFTTDFHAKFLDCYIIQNNEKFNIRWSEHQTGDAEYGLTIYALDIKTNDILETISAGEAERRIYEYDLDSIIKMGNEIYDRVYM